MISQTIPEVADVTVEDVEMLLDVERELDPNTGEVVFEVFAGTRSPARTEYRNAFQYPTPACVNTRGAYTLHQIP